MIIEGDISVKEPSEQLGVLGSTLRRWVSEYGKDGENAFPGSGRPTPNKDFEIFKLKKESGELRKENDLLKSRTLLKQSNA